MQSNGETMLWELGPWPNAAVAIGRGIAMVVIAGGLLLLVILLAVLDVMPLGVAIVFSLLLLLLFALGLLDLFTFGRISLRVTTRELRVRNAFARIVVPWSDVARIDEESSGLAGPHPVIRRLDGSSVSVSRGAGKYLPFAMVRERRSATQVLQQLHEQVAGGAGRR